MSLQIHNLIGWALVLVTLGLVGYWVPPAAEGIGESYLIFFFHFPSAINCLVMFTFAGLFALAYLVRGHGDPGFDFWSAAAVEVGVVACTVTLVTGSIWAKAAWGIFWDPRDMRLMTVAIMWFTYVGYLALRGSIDDPDKKARFSAVFAVVAMINVPLVHFSIKWFGESHHPFRVPMGATSMVVTRWFGAFAFFVLYTAVWRVRSRIARLRHEASVLEESFSRAGI